MSLRKPVVFVIGIKIIAILTYYHHFGTDNSYGSNIIYGLYLFKEVESMSENRNRKRLLENCDSRFYLYVDKVLARLPKTVCEKEILGDTTLKIVSVDGNREQGLYVSFADPPYHLIILNETQIDKPEFEIIHTIAHELAHKVAGKGKTGLWEKEAEELLETWGFEKEVEAVRYHLPLLEGEGYRIGYQWAKEHDLTDFEEFYDEWNEGQLSSQRWDELFYMADVTSILYQTGSIEKATELSDLSDIPLDAIVDDVGNLDRSIVEGIMCFLRDKKTASPARISLEDDVEEEFFQRLTRAFTEMGKVFGSGIFLKHRDKLPVFCQAYLEVGDFLENRKDMKS
jgi:hypothetical protein